jgi:hypothetical protein
MRRLRVFHPDINRDVVSEALVDVQSLEPKHGRLIERFCGYLGRMSDALIVLVGNDAGAKLAHGNELIKIRLLFAYAKPANEGGYSGSPRVALHSASRTALAARASVLGSPVPPLMVPVLGARRPLRTGRLAPSNSPCLDEDFFNHSILRLVCVPEARNSLALACPGSIAGGLRGVWVRAIWRVRPSAQPEWSPHLTFERPSAVHFCRWYRDWYQLANALFPTSVSGQWQLTPQRDHVRTIVTLH